MSQTQQVAIITGGASGIGRALGKALAAQGVYIVIADRNQDEGVKLAGEIERQGVRAAVRDLFR